MMMAEVKLSVLGEVCPFPLVKAKEAIQELVPDDVLTIDFDCTQATESIPRWADKEGHEIVDMEQTGDATWRISIRKK